jgi:hypothetical protein
MKEKRRKKMQNKKDKVQEAINKYGFKFHAFMLDLDRQIKNDKAFKNMKGNMFAGINSWAWRKQAAIVREHNRREEEDYLKELRKKL